MLGKPSPLLSVSRAEDSRTSCSSEIIPAGRLEPRTSGKIALGALAPIPSEKFPPRGRGPCPCLSRAWLPARNILRSVSRQPTVKHLCDWSVSRTTCCFLLPTTSRVRRGHQTLTLLPPFAHQAAHSAAPPIIHALFSTQRAHSGRPPLRAQFCLARPRRPGPAIPAPARRRSAVRPWLYPTTLASGHSHSPAPDRARVRPRAPRLPAAAVYK